MIKLIGLKKTSRKNATLNIKDKLFVWNDKYFIAAKKFLNFKFILI